MTYLAIGYRVRDVFRERSGGRVLRLRDRWVDIEWPDGTLSTYEPEAAGKFLQVERENRLGDLFGLGRTF